MNNTDTPTIQKETTTYSPRSGWQDHPLAVAAIAVAATIGLAVIIFKEIVLPTQTASLTNEITNLKSSLAFKSKEISTLKNSKLDSQKQIANLQSQVNELNQKVYEAQNANLFSFGNPYPLGVGRAKIKDPISTLTTIYPEQQITQNDGYWSVRNQHKIFTDITYYFDESSPQKTITHIAFSMDYSKNNEDFLQTKLIETLGQPKTWKRKGFFSWETKSSAIVYKSDNDRFILMQEGFAPGYWSKE